MKLRRESAENGDFSGPKGEFKNRFLSRKSAVIVASSSRRYEICEPALAPLFSFIFFKNESGFS
jgi:hypothetical protein